ncbi:hypothetical protein Leryth_004752 [Lithospermum erythrorhizon]|nr:hypothetical protein Leryth_004752 [Lithospermum erythrorhizon]
MDPCPFVRIVISNLALKLNSSNQEFSKIPSLVNSCYCKIKLNKGILSTHLSAVPLILQETSAIESKINGCFTFKKLELEKLVEKVCSKGQSFSLKIEVFAGKKGCGFKGGKLLGSVLIGLDLKGYVESGCNSRVVMQNGWMGVGKTGNLVKKCEVKHAELHLNVKAEHDPRFVFQFDGEPECSPQVFQVNGNVKQPVFSCKFGFRNSGDRNLRSRSSLSEPSTSTSCLAAFKSGNEKFIQERKGWSITIHDLCGSPVAAASMVTPFVPSQGTDRVSRSNPGAWLILRPDQGTWNPWGRLEAWREGSWGDQLGYRFELIPDGSIHTITLANSSISAKNGGKLSIDITAGSTPLTSPSSSFDLGSGSGSGSDLGSGYQVRVNRRNSYASGFVMSSTVEGDGKCSKPEVEVGVHHVGVRRGRWPCSAWR